MRISPPLQPVDHSAFAAAPWPRSAWLGIASTLNSLTGMGRWDGAPIGSAWLKADPELDIIAPLAHCWERHSATHGPGVSGQAQQPGPLADDMQALLLRALGGHRRRPHMRPGMRLAPQDRIVAVVVLCIPRRRPHARQAFPAAIETDMSPRNIGAVFPIRGRPACSSAQEVTPDDVVLLQIFTGDHRSQQVLQALAMLVNIRECCDVVGAVAIRASGAWRMWRCSLWRSSAKAPAPP